jgi:hypothetical protein
MNALGSLFRFAKYRQKQGYQNPDDDDDNQKFK